MCGIAGFWGDGTRRELEEMITALAHRGPDDSGITLRQGCGLAHARLSILDLSASGHQPMSLPDESVSIVFNGEIYNHEELRDALKRDGCVFAGTSDTEVILWLYKRKGIACFQNMVGMFALALHDRDTGTLILARDRMGEKPLYWTKRSGTIFFASELGALLQAGVARREVDAHSLAQYLFADYVPTPRSIIADVQKLEPASLLICTRDSMRIERYWSPPREASGLTFEDAQVQLDALLRRSVGRELLSSDVPTGVFLSGGIDSSTVAYYAQQASDRPVDTFSIAFEEDSFDESQYARAVATHLGTSHHEETLSVNEALALVEKVPDVLNEPVADASILPTLLISRFARRSVTVALGGDGGDELFAGYPTFQAEGPALFFSRMPQTLHWALSAAIQCLPASHENFSRRYALQKILSNVRRDPLHRHLEWLGSFPPDEISQLAGGQAAHAAEHLFSRMESYAGSLGEAADEGNRLLYAYARTYLMDQVLVKVDRASMRYALETRAPLLDHAVVEFAFSLPYAYKYRRGTTKRILKALMEKKLPPGIAHRKKKGFGIPLARWLARELRPLCEELLSPASLSVHGLFDEGYVQRLMQEHFDRKKDNRKELWNLMMFQLWYDKWMA